MVKDNRLKQDKPGQLITSVILGLICFLEYRALHLMSSPQEDNEKGMAYGIVHGTPLFRVFQSRILGPYAIELISHLTKHSFGSAFTIAMVLTTSLSCIICFAIIRHISGKNTQGLIWTGVYASAVVFSQGYFFHIFDAIDLSTMLVFAYIVIYAKNDYRLTVPLFFIELLNREAAGYVALWMILSGVGTWMFNSPNSNTRKKLGVQVVIGAILFGFGTWWTHKLRSLLFKHSYDPKVGLDLMHGSNGEQIVIKTNIGDLFHHQGGTDLIMALVFCIGIYLTLRFIVAKNGKAAYPSVVLLLVMAGSVWLFGNILFERVWLNFIPFFLMASHLLFNGGISSTVAPEISTHERVFQTAGRG